MGAGAMSVSPGANHCLLLKSETKLSVDLILRSDARHCVSKDGPESVAGLAHTGASFEAPAGRLRARGKEFLRTRGETR
jgi:hypothetical protein